jgi:hypothetical protein
MERGLQATLMEQKTVNKLQNHQIIDLNFLANSFHGWLETIPI